MHIFFLIYMLKTALCLSVFYLFYRFWLSKETFHRFNRMVLIGLILVAFVIPSLKVSQNFHLPQIEQVFERLNIPVMNQQNSMFIYLSPLRRIH